MSNQARTYLYLLRHRDFPVFKIGISVDPIQRVQALSEPVSLKASIEYAADDGGAKAIEQYLHHRFRNARYFGVKGVGRTEWFSIDVLESVQDYLTENRQELGLSAPRPVLDRIQDKKPTKRQLDHARCMRRGRFRKLSKVVDNMRHRAAMEKRRSYVEELNLETVDTLYQMLQEAQREHALIGLIQAGWVFDRCALVFSGPRSEYWSQQLAGGASRSFHNFLLSFPGNAHHCILGGSFRSDHLRASAVFVERDILFGRLDRRDVEFPHSGKLAEIIETYEVKPGHTAFSEGSVLFRRLLVEAERTQRRMHRYLGEGDFWGANTTNTLE